MTYTKKKILPALHRSDKVSKPDLQQIGDQNYTDTILRYGNLAVKHAELNTNAKTVVDAINELYATKSTVIPNPPDTPTDNLYTVKIDGDTYRISGGSTVIPNPPIPTSGVIITEDGQIIITESGDGLLPEQGGPGPTPVLPKLYTIGIDGEIYEVAGGSYVLPIASAETLGGIKVGSGLSIDSETGVLSANDDVEYYPGRGIFFSAEITEEFYTEAPQESGSGAGLSYTTCPLKYKADTTYGNPVTICHPIRGSLFGGVYDSTTNSVLVTCRDYVPEGTLIQIKYTANIAEANSINADAGRRSSAYTYIRFRTDYMSPKNSWKSTGTYVDGNLVQVSQAITDPPYRCFSWGQLEITGIQDITLYIKQDSINTNTAYILISKPGKTFRVKTTDTFNGDGVTNVFTLSHEIYRPAMAPYVTFEPSGSYPNTVSGNTITFTGTIPPVGTKISVQYYYMDTSSNKVFKSYKGVTTSDYDSCYISLGGGSSDYYQRVVDILYVKDGDATISNSVAYFYYEAGNAYIGANGEIFNDYNNNYAIGFQSHAEGGSSLAMGNRSHAEGMSKAVGSFSHSEGEDTTALGGNSHAEGEETIASGTSSHSEGELTLASGENSHAEGTHTQALGGHSHAEGGSTYAEGMHSHSEGIWTHATGDASHAEGDSTRALSSSAHAEGILTIAESAYSHAEGSSTKASGGSSHAEGNYTRALGYTSHAEGNYSQATAQYSHAEGSYTVASNYYAHAEGNSTTASGGDGAHSEGNNTVASGSSAHAEGTYTQATGAGSHAGGGYSIASGQYSYAMGDNATASGAYSHAEGQTTVASGTRSHAEGWNTTASEASAHAEGDSTTASSSYAHAEGQNSVASNAAAHAEGDSSTASGYASHAEGVHTQATGAGSHAEGYSDVGAEIVASGRGAHAEGFMTSAVGMASHAEGGGSKALGQESHAEGGGTVVYGNWSHGEGAGNTAYAYYSHIEGAGTKSFEVFTHVEGAGNKNIAQYSHLEGGGNSTTSSAHMSHTEGAGNTNYGHQSHIEGSGNRVSGEESHVEGAGNQVHGPKTHAEGGGNTAYTIGSHVEGKHNFIAGFGVHAEGSFNCIGSTASVPQFSYGTTYAVGDIVGVNDNYVRHGNELTDPLLFRCITAPGQIQAGTGIEIVAANSWDSSTTYPANSIVKFTDGSTGYYRNSSEISAGGNPPPANSNWQKISQILSPMFGKSGATTRFTNWYGNGQYTGCWLNGSDTAQTIVSITVDGVPTTGTLEQGGRLIRLPFAPANGAYVIMEYYVVQAYEYSYYLLSVDSELGYNDPIAKVQNIVSISPMWEAVATPKYAHIEGFYNIALGDYQHVGGKFNSADANKAVIIGNGADGNSRANAYTLDWSGNATFAGDITVGTHLSTMAQTIGGAINELYQTGGGSTVSVTQIQSSGNQVASITVDGTTTMLYSKAGVESASVTADLSSGTKVATIDIDGTATDIYAPDAGDSVSVTQITSTGTHIADIEVDGVTTELYAPNGGGAIIDDNDIALDKTWSSDKINTLIHDLAVRVADIERYLWGQPVLTEDGDNRVTEDGNERILEENEE